MPYTKYDREQLTHGRNLIEAARAETLEWVGDNTTLEAANKIISLGVGAIARQAPLSKLLAKGELEVLARLGFLTFAEWHMDRELEKCAAVLRSLEKN